MQEPTIRFPVTCPTCALVSLSEIPIAAIAGALLLEKNIRLHAGCHDQYWTATFIEREQLRKHLRAMKVQSRQDARQPERLPGQQDSMLAGASF
jgi:hypothetical protein